MNRSLVSRSFGSVFAAAMLLSAQSALAQVVWDVTPDQERTIYTTIYQDRGTVGTAPMREYDVSIGAAIPADVELYEVPATIQYESARSYRYVTYGNRVVFVEPGSRRIVRVIGP